VYQTLVLSGGNHNGNVTSLALNFDWHVLRGGDDLRKSPLSIA